MSKQRVQRWKSRFWWLLFLAITVIYMAPLIITFTNSFMSSTEVERNYNVSGMEEGSYVDMNLIPEKVTLSQYAELLFDSPVYLNMFWNSVKITVPIVVGQIIVSTLAAYAFTVLKFKGKELLFFLYIIVMLLPLQVTLMPNYIVADWLGITDSYLAIILSGIFNPFGVFLLRQFMKSLPDAYLEAAKIDGAGNGKIFISIILPMIKPGIAATAMLTLLDYWNLVDQAIIFIQDSEKQPLSTFLAQINNGDIGLAFAGSCFYAVPMLLVLLYGQEHLKQGIAITGIKG
ncbi:carbohydrate ABC transporter permease [Waltera intestinalis]|uniref:Carbohydrate ABC transporter permease n=1 Tax=Waltera intestinalis TaxID=2606635 RepID=A0A6L5YNN1_9FIRM|nr:carbohydrate ABC transporter permease [Waltera intestinalis]MST59202.1 carbohydrate ABC transporter permease [Waltera intestinalis]